MKINISTRHFELTDDLKQRAEERLGKLQRFFDRILDARVVISLEKNRYNAEGTLTANGTPIVSRAVAESDRAAVEQVLDKMEVQLRRHKDRLTRHKRRTGTGEALAAAESDLSPGEDTEILSPAAFDETDMDNLVTEDGGDFSVSMPVAEAAAQLRTSKREALGFTNPVTGRHTLVFKRRDGNVGVVDIQSN